MDSFELIKDIEGKNNLSFKKLKKEDTNRIGSKVDDFEIFRKLGEDGSYKVYKVRSKINKQIYTMKKLNMKKLKDNNINVYWIFLHEIRILSELTQMSNHVNLVKYYNYFEEGEFIYILIEYIGNGNMKNFIEAHKKVGSHIPEEQLWNIFLQCMKGLSFLHKMRVIHINIKPENLLMDNNMTIKLGNFGFPYIENVEDKKPILIENYENKEKDDVYAMGVSFFEMCYYHVPKSSISKKDSNGDYYIIFEKFEEPEDVDVHYSKELLHIIGLMVEDKDKRKNSEYFLEMIKKEFYKKYSNNNSLDAIIRCLYSFKELTKYYLNIGEPNKSKPITNAYRNCLKSFTAPTLKSWYNSIKIFGELLSSENTKFNIAKEIEPKLILTLIIHKLHNEINDDVKSYKMNQYYMKSAEENLKTNDAEMLIHFGNEFFTKFNSYISKKFLGLIKNIYKCTFCNLITYSFSICLFFTFDLETFNNKNMLDGKLNIEKCFNLQKSIEKFSQKYCIKCQNKTNHSQLKNIYSLPDYMIISIKRGFDNSIKYPVEYKEILDLSNISDLKGKKYKLVGSRNKNYNNGKYYSIFNFNKNYFKCEGLNIKIINTNGIFNDSQGELIILLYESINN